MMPKFVCIVTIVMALSFSACSTQPAVSSSSGANAQVASKQNCELDVKKVCQELRNKPVIDSATGLTEDTTEVEQNGPRTVSEFTTVAVPNGSVIQVQCEMNTTHHSVVYAHQMPGPPLTPTDIAFVQNAGYCVH
ncbi:MAG TPA: hypothetical protein VN867_09065 [Candidatus Binataceae bacterium]|jgi:hypothetical protein|nr:hypothetical protein [Candidatus Binataceae bacterium]